MDDKILDIIGIECEDGRVFISLVRKDYNFSAGRLGSLLFDGAKPEFTFLRDWFVIPKKPRSVQKLVQQPNINYRYELIDPELESEKFPAVFKREDVAKIDEENSYQWTWKAEFTQLESLYAQKCDPVDPVLEDLEFNYQRTLKVKGIPDPPEFSYEAGEDLKISRGDIKSQILDQLVFPGPILHLKPSRLSSHDTYRIIRRHVQININPEAAVITSDYEFCFTVKKRILFAEPEKYTIDVNAYSRRKRRPKLEVRYRKAREVTCFEMTHSASRYKGYTIIEGFIGKNHKDLQERIDNYLKDLIEFINKPLEDCPECNGLGVMKSKLGAPKTQKGDQKDG